MMSKERLEIGYVIEMVKRETVIAKGINNTRDNVNLPIDLVLVLIEQAKKRVRAEVIDLRPGGGNCPSCEIRLMGKANYCGRCGQRVGWKAKGGNVYDERGESW